MALKAGTENKRQVALAIVLFIIVLGAGVFEIKTYLFPATPPPPALRPAPVAAVKPAAQKSNPASGNGPEAQKLSSNLDPTLYFEKLLRTEQVEYSGSGRNIFSADSAPIVKIPEPIRNARPNGPAVDASQPQIPEKPKAPPIDMKYFGYVVGKDKTIRGYFLRGEEIYAAKNGDIVDHRFKIGQILPGNAQVTDLGYNNTQVLPLTAN
jgi:hypothetical protein